MKEGTIINEGDKYAYVVYKIKKRYYFGRFINYPEVEAKGVCKNHLEINLEEELKEFLIKY